MRYGRPLLGRFAGKLVFDVLPAVLASLIGGFLLTHYGFGRATEPAFGVAPASAEMMQLLRDEHGLIVNFLKAQLEDEKRQLAAEDAARHVAAAPQAPAVARPTAVAMAAPKFSAPKEPRGKASAVGASLPPLVIAQTLPSESARTAPASSDSTLTQPIGIREHVVAVTHRVVSAITGIPSWIGSIGDRIGGEGANPRPPANLVSAS